MKNVSQRNLFEYNTELASKILLLSPFVLKRHVWNLHDHDMQSDFPERLGWLFAACDPMLSYEKRKSQSSKPLTKS